MGYDNTDCNDVGQIWSSYRFTGRVTEHSGVISDLLLVYRALYFMKLLGQDLYSL